MDCYVRAIQNMELSGPTYFAPLLTDAFKWASKLQGGYSYQIILILTDGEIHDMGSTKDLLVQHSNLPVSVIIVGIGNADFSKMVALDGDGGLTDSHGKRCPRDIVQFVPFNKFKGNSQALAQEMLREVPKQVTQYFVIFFLSIDEHWQKPKAFKSLIMIAQNLFHSLFKQKFDKFLKSFNIINIRGSVLTVLNLLYGFSFLVQAYFLLCLHFSIFFECMPYFLALTVKIWP